MESKKETIIFFPFMSQGHITPFLALALETEKKGYNIVFINTPLNIKKLKTTIPTSSSIKLLQLPFNSSDHGLPPDSEDTDLLPYNLIFQLLEVSSCLEAPLRQLINDLIIQQGGVKPLCVIADFFLGWSAKVVHEFDVFHAIFSGSGGYGLACYYSMWLTLPHKQTEKVEFCLPDFPEAGKFHISQLSASFLVADGSDPYSTFQRRNLPTWLDSDAVLFNTIEEIDQIGLVYFRRKLGIPIWAIGPILLSQNHRVRDSITKPSNVSLEQCIEFLDSKERNSVLYISFGSQNSISASQMMKLARALDTSGKNFIWVVRPPLGFDINAEFKAEEWLPEGFVERVEEEKRGLIISNWAPQVEILSHKSVAAFFNHCGWNSVLESLVYGIPIIGWPMAAEQFFNAKFLVEELGVCLEVARGVNFEVRHEDIAQMIEMLMGEKNKKGKEMRNKCYEIKKLIKDAIRDEDNFKGSSVNGMDEFLMAAMQVKEDGRW
ncbi:hypothetical protein Leryth_003663 [Lithospermum erythrorhizon]|nr:hypothetical protein Leryth_003663 [Lithospermum erythrorhizon]